MKELELNVFPGIDKNHWMQLAEKQLKGADPATELAWENSANIHLGAYYDASDTTGLGYLQDFFSNIEPHEWKLYERIESSSPKQANSKALKALMGGCNGIILEQPNNKDFDTLLNDVNPEICDVCIVSSKALESKTSFTGFQLYPNGNCIDSEEKKNPIEQLAQLLMGVTNQTHVHRIALPDFFLEIATVRSLRYLLNSQGINDVSIHTHIPLHESDEHQWFLNTTAGLSSILGGSHSIDLPTAQGDSRISRNTGNLIREESGIEIYSDQCGGSYYIEALTDKIIKQVTEKLKQ